MKVENYMKRLFAASLVATALACVIPAHAADTEKLDARITAAHAVLHELMATPERGRWFNRLWRNPVLWAGAAIPLTVSPLRSKTARR